MKPQPVLVAWLEPWAAIPDGWELWPDDSRTDVIRIRRPMIEDDAMEPFEGLRVMMAVRPRPTRFRRLRMGLERIW